MQQQHLRALFVFCSIPIPSSKRASRPVRWRFLPTAPEQTTTIKPSLPPSLHPYMDGWMHGYAARPYRVVSPVSYIFLCLERSRPPFLCRALFLHIQLYMHIAHTYAYVCMNVHTCICTLGVRLLTREVRREGLRDGGDTHCSHWLLILLQERKRTLCAMYIHTTQTQRSNRLIASFPIMVRTWCTNVPQTLPPSNQPGMEDVQCNA